MTIPTFTSDAEREFWQRAFLMDPAGCGHAEFADEALYCLRRRMPTAEDIEAQVRMSLPQEPDERHEWGRADGEIMTVRCSKCGAGFNPAIEGYPAHVGCPGYMAPEQPEPSVSSLRKALALAEGKLADALAVAEVAPRSEAEPGDPIPGWTTKAHMVKSTTDTTMVWVHEGVLWHDDDERTTLIPLEVIDEAARIQRVK